jgi:hypothetical protein
VLSFGREGNSRISELLRTAWEGSGIYSAVFSEATGEDGTETDRGILFRLSTMLSEESELLALLFLGWRCPFPLEVGVMCRDESLELLWRSSGYGVPPCCSFAPTSFSVALRLSGVELPPVRLLILLSALLLTELTLSFPSITFADGGG